MLACSDGRTVPPLRPSTLMAMTPIRHPAVAGLVPPVAGVDPRAGGAVVVVSGCDAALDPLRWSADADLPGTPGVDLNEASAPSPMRVAMTAGVARLMIGPCACSCS